MKNIKTLEHFLLESKNSAMKYLTNWCGMDEDTFYHFLDMDKTPTKKYVEKMCEFYCDGETDGIDIFHELIRLNIPNVDVNSIETLSDVADIIEEYKLSGKRERIKLDPSLDGGVLVFQNERFDVIYIQDENSSCYYGKGTKWCISANQSGGINMWNDNNYADLNFYFVFDYQTMDKSLKRLAVGVPNKKSLKTIVWNSRDNQTGTRVNMDYLYNQGIPENVFKHHKQLKKKIKKTMLKFKDFINEELQFEINITKPLYLEFGENEVLLTKDGPQSHIRDNFQRTIDKITIFDNGHKVVNKDGVVNKVPINKDQVLDDVLFSIPKIIDFIFRGRAELIRGWGRLVTPEICLEIDPTYKPNERAILLHIKNIRTGLNTILKFRYYKSPNDLDYIVLKGVTTIWKPNFKNYCLREDYTIEIDNDNIRKFYTQYPLK